MGDLSFYLLINTGNFSESTQWLFYVVFQHLLDTFLKLLLLDSYLKFRPLCHYLAPLLPLATTSEPFITVLVRRIHPHSYSQHRRKL